MHGVRRSPLANTTLTCSLWRPRCASFSLMRAAVSRTLSLPPCRRAAHACWTIGLSSPHCRCVRRCAVRHCNCCSDMPSRHAGDCAGQGCLALGEGARLLCV
jgi:hypothetical protein